MIRVEGLAKTYSETVAPVLAGVSFEVRPGEILWVSGPSGAGKSTLLNVLGLLTGANAGSYHIGDVDMLHAPQHVRRRARSELVSMVFQRGNLFDHLSALENVLVGMSHGGVPDALAQLEAVGMGSKAGQRAGLLSGGEQGRVAFARAAARKTPILLADEPVAGLDDGNATIVLDLLAGEARRGVAVVVVSHDDRVTTIGTCHLRLGKGVAA